MTNFPPFVFRKVTTHKLSEKKSLIQSLTPKFNQQKSEKNSFENQELPIKILICFLPQSRVNKLEIVKPMMNFLFRFSVKSGRRENNS